VHIPGSQVVVWVVAAADVMLCRCLVPAEPPAAFDFAVVAPHEHDEPAEQRHLTKVAQRTGPGEIGGAGS
jgi:hypothetical protein